MGTSVENFQISAQAADIYESQFVPALFAEWAPLTVEAGGVSEGDRVLDVACGTGIVARSAADIVGASGSVVGVDLNPEMLAVASRLRPDLEWREGDAGDLPFENDVFDVVLCQSALMFFPDPVAAIDEMGRVVRAGGTVAVQVWSSLESQPAYGPFVDVAAKHVGPEARDLLNTYWSMGDLAVTKSYFEDASLDVSGVRTHLGTAHFPSLDAMVKTEVEGTPLIERISDEQYEAILREVRELLSGFAASDGAAAVPIEGHLLTAKRA